MMDLNKKLRDSGELISAEGLSWPGEARIVRADNDGQPITDRKFPESKDFLIGYWIVKVQTVERAHALAAEASSAPGMGGIPLNMPIEVRQIMEAPPEIRP